MGLVIKISKMGGVPASFFLNSSLPLFLTFIFLIFIQTSCFTVTDACDGNESVDPASDCQPFPPEELIITEQEGLNAEDKLCRKIAWKNSDVATSYEVSAFCGGTKLTNCEPEAGMETSANFLSVERGSNSEICEYRVRSCTASGCGLWSNEISISNSLLAPELCFEYSSLENASAETPPDTSYCVMADDQEYVVLTNINYIITWNDLNQIDRADTYQFSRWKYKPLALTSVADYEWQYSDYIPYGSTTLTGIPYGDGNTDYGQIYEFRVRACRVEPESDSEACSPWNHNPIRLVVLPPQITELRCDDCQSSSDAYDYSSLDGNYTISWDSIPGSTGYRVLEKFTALSLLESSALKIPVIEASYQSDENIAKAYSEKPLGVYEYSLQACVKKDDGSDPNFSSEHSDADLASHCSPVSESILVYVSRANDANLRIDITDLYTHNNQYVISWDKMYFEGGNQIGIELHENKTAITDYPSIQETDDFDNMITCHSREDSGNRVQCTIMEKEYGSRYTYKLKIQVNEGDSSDLYELQAEYVTVIIVPRKPSEISSRLDDPLVDPGKYTIVWSDDTGNSGVSYELQECHAFCSEKLSWRELKCNTDYTDSCYESKEFSVDAKDSEYFEKEYQYRVRACTNRELIQKHTCGPFSEIHIVDLRLDIPVLEYSLLEQIDGLGTDYQFEITWDQILKATLYKVEERPDTGNWVAASDCIVESTNNKATCTKASNLSSDRENFVYRVSACIEPSNFGEPVCGEPSEALVVDVVRELKIIDSSDNDVDLKKIFQDSLSILSFAPQIIGNETEQYKHVISWEALGSTLAAEGNVLGDTQESVGSCETSVIYEIKQELRNIPSTTDIEYIGNFPTVSSSATVETLGDGDYAFSSEPKNTTGCSLDKSECVSGTSPCLLKLLCNNREYFKLYNYSLRVCLAPKNDCVEDNNFDYCLRWETIEQTTDISDIPDFELGEAKDDTDPNNGSGGNIYESGLGNNYVIEWEGLAWPLWGKLNGASTSTCSDPSYTTQEDCEASSVKSINLRYKLQRRERLGVDPEFWSEWDNLGEWGPFSDAERILKEVSGLYSEAFSDSAETVYQYHLGICNDELSACKYGLTKKARVKLPSKLQISSETSPSSSYYQITWEKFTGLNAYDFRIFRAYYQHECEAITPIWDSGTSTCSDSRYSDMSSCEAARPVWTEAFCSNSVHKSEAACVVDHGLSWTDAYCSDTNYSGGNDDYKFHISKIGDIITDDYRGIDNNLKIAGVPRGYSYSHNAVPNASSLNETPTSIIIEIEKIRGSYYGYQLRGCVSEYNKGEDDCTGYTEIVFGGGEQLSLNVNDASDVLIPYGISVTANSGNNLDITTSADYFAYTGSTYKLSWNTDLNLDNLNLDNINYNIEECVHDLSLSDGGCGVDSVSWSRISGNISKINDSNTLAYSVAGRAIGTYSYRIRICNDKDKDRGCSEKVSQVITVLVKSILEFKPKVISPSNSAKYKLFWDANFDLNNLSNFDLSYSIEECEITDAEKCELSSSAWSDSTFTSGISSTCPSEHKIGDFACVTPCTDSTTDPTTDSTEVGCQISIEISKDPADFQSSFRYRLVSSAGETSSASDKLNLEYRIIPEITIDSLPVNSSLRNHNISWASIDGASVYQIELCKDGICGIISSCLDPYVPPTWNSGSDTCSNPSYTTQASCEYATVCWIDLNSGTCSDTIYTDRFSCQSADERWVLDDLNSGTCIDDIYTDRSSCQSADKTWVLDDLNSGTCIDDIYTDRLSCQSADKTWVSIETRSITNIRRDDFGKDFSYRIRPCTDIDCSTSESNTRGWSSDKRLVVPALALNLHLRQNYGGAEDDGGANTNNHYNDLYIAGEDKGYDLSFNSNEYQVRWNHETEVNLSSDAVTYVIYEYLIPSDTSVNIDLDLISASVIAIKPTVAEEFQLFGDIQNQTTCEAVALPIWNSGTDDICSDPRHNGDEGACNDASKPEWTSDECDDPRYPDEESCKAAPEPIWIEAGTCSDGTTVQKDCETAAEPKWDSVNSTCSADRYTAFAWDNKRFKQSFELFTPYCSDNSYDNKADCEDASEEWTSRYGKTYGYILLVCPESVLPDKKYSHYTDDESCLVENETGLKLSIPLNKVTELEIKGDASGDSKAPSADYYVLWNGIADAGGYVLKECFRENDMMTGLMTCTESTDFSVQHDPNNSKQFKKRNLYQDPKDVAAIIGKTVYYSVKPCPPPFNSDPSTCSIGEYTAEVGLPLSLENPSLKLSTLKLDATDPPDSASYLECFGQEKTITDISKCNVTNKAGTYKLSWSFVEGANQYIFTELQNASVISTRYYELYETGVYTNIYRLYETSVLNGHRVVFESGHEPNGGDSLILSNTVETNLRATAGESSYNFSIDYRIANIASGTTPKLSVAGVIQNTANYTYAAISDPYGYQVTFVSGHEPSEGALLTLSNIVETSLTATAGKTSYDFRLNYNIANIASGITPELTVAGVSQVSADYMIVTTSNPDGYRVVFGNGNEPNEGDSLILSNTVGTSLRAIADEASYDFSLNYNIADIASGTTPKLSVAGVSQVSANYTIATTSNPDGYQVTFVSGHEPSEGALLTLSNIVETSLGATADKSSYNFSLDYNIANVVSGTTPELSVAGVIQDTANYMIVPDVPLYQLQNDDSSAVQPDYKFYKISADGSTISATPSTEHEIELSKRGPTADSYEYTIKATNALLSTNNNIIKTISLYVDLVLPEVNSCTISNIITGTSHDGAYTITWDAIDSDAWYPDTSVNPAVSVPISYRIQERKKDTILSTCSDGRYSNQTSCDAAPAPIWIEANKCSDSAYLDEASCKAAARPIWNAATDAICSDGTTDETDCKNALEPSWDLGTSTCSDDRYSDQTSCEAAPAPIWVEVNKCSDSIYLDEASCEAAARPIWNSTTDAICSDSTIDEVVCKNSPPEPSWWGVWSELGKNSPDTVAGTLAETSYNIVAKDLGIYQYRVQPCTNLVCSPAQDLAVLCSSSGSSGELEVKDSALSFEIANITGGNNFQGNVFFKLSSQASSYYSRGSILTASGSVTSSNPDQTIAIGDKYLQYNINWSVTGNSSNSYPIVKEYKLERRAASSTDDWLKVGDGTPDDNTDPDNFTTSITDLAFVDGGAFNIDYEYRVLACITDSYCFTLDEEGEKLPVVAIYNLSARVIFTNAKHVADNLYISETGDFSLGWWGEAHTEGVSYIIEKLSNTPFTSSGREFLGKTETYSESLRIIANYTYKVKACVDILHSDIGLASELSLSEPALSRCGAEWSNEISVSSTRVDLFGEEENTNLLGSVDNPYLIHNYDELRQIKFNPSGHYALVNDIDAYSSQYQNCSGIICSGWEPVIDFTGVLNGRGYAVKDLYINRENETYVGLFAKILGGSKIYNIGLEYARIRGGDLDDSTDDFTGALVGGSQGIIANSYVQGVVEGGGNVGGLVAQQVYSSSGRGKIKNSYMIGRVRGITNVGGLVGENASSIENSYMRGSIVATSTDVSYIGGIVGTVAEISAPKTVAGVSAPKVLINNSYVVSRIDNYGRRLPGALIGWNVDGDDESGDITGKNIIAVEFTGKGAEKSLCVDDENPSDDDCILAAPSNDPSTKTNGYYNITAYNELSDFMNDSDPYSGNVNWGKTATSSTSLPYLNYVDDTQDPNHEDYYADSCDSDDTKDYLPKCEEPIKNQKSEIFAAGTGAIGRPYEIENYSQLKNIYHSLSSHYRLTKDISATDSQREGVLLEGWQVLGDDAISFSGTLNGNDHVIFGLFINNIDEDKLGLFGVTDSDALITNLGVSDIFIYGNSQLGGLVGSNRGEIVNSYVRGSVENSIIQGDKQLGGLVGYNNGTIRNSYTNILVSGRDGANDGTSDIGGLVGINSSNISNAYTKGAVSGNSNSENVGTLVGRHQGGEINSTYTIGLATGASNVGGIVGKIESGAKLAKSYFHRGATGITAVGDGSCTGICLKKDADKLTISELANNDGHNDWKESFDISILQLRHALIEKDGVQKGCNSSETPLCTNILPNQSSDISITDTELDRYEDLDKDSDEDGILDTIDACPDGITGPHDTNDDIDNDGCHNNEDNDDDNDGIVDANDSCPYSSSLGGTDDNKDGCDDNNADEDGDFITEADGDVDKDNNGLIEIRTAEELVNIRYDLDGSHYDDEEADRGSGDEGTKEGCPSSGCTGYELENDIDLADIDLTNNWTPVGSLTEKFSGTFEGNGYTIYNLNIVGESTSNVVAFFSAVSGSVRNLRFSEVFITSNLSETSSYYVMGTVVGEVGRSASLDNVSAVNIFLEDKSRLAAPGYIGGLVGYNSNTISNSYVNGGKITITGESGEQDDVGGLVGQNAKTIENSYVMLDVYGGADDNDNVGGLVGNNRGTILNSYAVANVKGGAGIGDDVGGLVGQNAYMIENSYAIGNHGAGDTTSDNVGGLVGSGNSNTVVDSYYSGTIGGILITVGTGDIDAYGSYLNLDSFTSLTLNGAGTNWTADNWAGMGPTEIAILPTLRFSSDENIICEQDNKNNTCSDDSFLSQTECQSNGEVWTGTRLLCQYKRGDIDSDDDGLIEIYSEVELNNIRYNLAGTSYKISYSDKGTNSGCPPSGCYGYELMNDITSIDIIYWNPVGDELNPFTGSFKGNGKTISKFSINSSAMNIGFFGVLSGNAKVTKLKLRNGLVRASDTANLFYSIGAVAGKLIGNSSLDDVSAVNVNVSGNSKSGYLGGLAGIVQDTSIVMNSYANSSISGGSANFDIVGGLVGRNDNMIKNSYAMGDISGGAGDFDKIGGLVAFNNGGTISNTYAIGNVDGGDGDRDYVGALIGWATSGTILSSYATGNADGGSGLGDYVARLVGKDDGIVIRESYSNRDASISNNDNNGNDSMSQTLANLKALILGTSAWSSDNWTGNNDTTDVVDPKLWHLPTLRYSDSDDIICEQDEKGGTCTIDGGVNNTKTLCEIVGGTWDSDRCGCDSGNTCSY